MVIFCLKNQARLIRFTRLSWWLAPSWLVTDGPCFSPILRGSRRHRVRAWSRSPWAFVSRSATRWASWAAASALAFTVASPDRAWSRSAGAAWMAFFCSASSAAVWPAGGHLVDGASPGFLRVLVFVALAPIAPVVALASHYPLGSSKKPLKRRSGGFCDGVSRRGPLFHSSADAGGASVGVQPTVGGRSPQGSRGAACPSPRSAPRARAGRRGEKPQSGPLWCPPAGGLDLLSFGLFGVRNAPKRV